MHCFCYQTWQAVPSEEITKIYLKAAAFPVPNLATIFASLRLKILLQASEQLVRPVSCEIQLGVGMITTGAAEQLIHPRILSSMPRVASLTHSVESKLQHFGLTQRQVSNEMPDTPISAGVIESLLGQARTKEVGLVANVAGKVRKTFFREVQAKHE